MTDRISVAAILAMDHHRHGPSAAQVMARYADFMLRADILGLSAEQARTLVRSDGLLTSISAATGTAEWRLEYFAAHGYLLVLLGEVLTLEEVAAQPLGYGTVLNAPRWMGHTYGRHFFNMGRDRQHGLVDAAVELMAQLGGAKEGWPLERAVAAVMPYLEEA